MSSASRVIFLQVEKINTAWTQGIVHARLVVRAAGRAERDSWLPWPDARHAVACAGSGVYLAAACAARGLVSSDVSRRRRRASVCGVCAGKQRRDAARIADPVAWTGPPPDGTRRMVAGRALQLYG